jgi:hypothetical protein
MSHALTNHVIFIKISAYFWAEGGAIYQALDAVSSLDSRLDVSY